MNEADMLRQGDETRSTKLHAAHAAAYAHLQLQPANKQGVTVVMLRSCELLQDSATGKCSFGEPESVYQKDVELWQVPDTAYYTNGHFLAKEQDGEIFALDDTQVIFDSDYDELIVALEAAAQ